ncbi:MAG TPA: FecR family protein [Rhodocyclaceae bacterium]|nr:FecR family protein [Rhodocyclaceae bacterium]
MRLRPCALVVLLGWSCLATASTDDPIGFVKTVAGEVTVVGKRGTVAATPGVPLELGDIVRTRADGRVGLTLKDDTVLSLGPNSELSLTEFTYAPARGELGLGARLSSGTLQFISGVIARLKPESVSIATPNATIGVRGTRFVVKVP